MKNNEIEMAIRTICDSGCEAEAIEALIKSLSRKIKHTEELVFGMEKSMVTINSINRKYYKNEIIAALSDGYDENGQE